MLLCHGSDWHGRWVKLPPADIYIFTGDMLYNYPNSRGEITRDREVRKQTEEVQKVEGRQYLGTPDAPVILVRGNHDFVPLASAFTDGPVYEIQDHTKSFVLHGVRFGGMRGINWCGGEWSDEMQPQDIDTKVLELNADLDVILTHAPPNGILDEADGQRFGVKGLTHYHYNRWYHGDGLPAAELHCFGHIHESFGTEEHEGTLFSNAAVGFNLIELDKNAQLVSSQRK